ncbi:hypothetical protein Avbf_00133 [Armadillidium vulgare]|nr:hypothetical protein Avbf_00133 [Armadillidium vulgare]
MINHTSLKHDIKSQYKCGYCKVRSSARTSFEVHFAKKHPDKKFRVLCMYYRLDSDDIEPLPPGGSASSHEPLWKRNDPDRRKMIRGILLEDDEEDKELNFLNILPGSPNGEEFVCPKCLSFKTPCVSTFRSHLCKEANYQRFECAECGMTNPLLASLRRHYTKIHGSHFTSDCYITLPIESTLEAWVESIISHQQHMIKLYKENDVSNISLASPSKAATSRRSSSHSEIEVSGMVLHESGSDKSKYTCSFCGVECRTASGLKSHKTAMHQAKYKCQYCPFSSNTELGIHNHQTLKHPKQNSADEGNKIINVSTSSDTELIGQEDDKKVEKQKHACPHCPFTSNVMKTLQLHLQTHFTFVCEYCEKRFETIVDGKRHSTRKHPNMPAKIINSLVDSPQTLKKSSFDDNENGKEKEIIKPQDPVVTKEVKSRTICYSCCHCSIKGPYSFVEDHIKAHHKFLPFLVRKEEENSFTLEVYKYRCIHCKNESDSFEEAMGHWTRSHVRLSFTFSMSLCSSTIIKCDSDSSNNSKEEPESSAKSESLPDQSLSVSKPEFSTPKNKNTVSAKPDSSIPSDLDDSVESTDDDLNSSFSSEAVETGTDCEAEPVSSSSDQEQLVKCGYCRRQCKE